MRTSLGIDVSSDMLSKKPFGGKLFVAEGTRVSLVGGHSLASEVVFELAVAGKHGPTSWASNHLLVCVGMHVFQQFGFCLRSIAAPWGKREREKERE